MRRRRKNFRNWVLVPALASIGITLVAYGQNLMLEEVSLAAPAAALPAAANPAPAAAKPAPAAAASGSVATTEGNPEFGGSGAAGQAPAQQAPAHIRSTTQDELVRKARENSGREDPFVSLILPQAIIIAPVAPPVAPAPVHTVSRPPTMTAPTRIHPVTGRRQVLSASGMWMDEEISMNPDEPRWTVQGILNTGRESLVILELDATTREAHIGEVLEDGAKVVAISGSQVTLLAHGRRYVKNIGGLEPQ